MTATAGVSGGSRHVVQNEADFNISSACESKAVERIAQCFDSIVREMYVAYF